MRLPEKGRRHPSGAVALLSYHRARVPARLLAFLLDQLGDALPQLLDLAMEGLELLDAGVRAVGAGRAVGQEAGRALLGRNQGRAGRYPDHGGALGHVLGDHRIGADPGPVADLDRAEHGGARADDDAVADRRVAVAALAAGRIGAAQGDVLVDGDLVADHRRLADHDEAVVDEEIASDLGAGMDVDRGKEAGEMVDQPGGEVELALEQPVREAMEAERQHAGIEQYFPSRTRRRIARLDRIEIGYQP